MTTKWTIIFFLSYWVKFTQMSFKWSTFNLHSPSYAILASCVLDSEFRIEYLFEIHATSWKRIVFYFTSTNRCTYSIDLFFQERRKLLFYDLRLRFELCLSCRHLNKLHENKVRLQFKIVLTVYWSTTEEKFDNSVPAALAVQDTKLIIYQYFPCRCLFWSGEFSCHCR